MLIGDLNMTSDSPVFQNFLRETGLRDTRAGFGIQATWPTNVPVLWIAIDHCLVSDKVLVHDRRVGPGVGSDHLPLTVDVSVRE
jgi:endonuclease/exonuclease/phosphatase family metal-dependent hydrolase